MSTRRVRVALAVVLTIGSSALATPQASAGDGGANQSFGLSVTDTTVAATAVSTTATALPAPQAGAEVYLRPASGSFAVVGGGFGHGIGMSQYGANGAGAAGLSGSQILSFYYPGTVLQGGAPASIRIGITLDNDGVTRVGARPGLAMTTGGTTEALPAAPAQWRVSASGTTADSCGVESFDGSVWTAYRPDATPCPVVFAGTEGSVDLFLPSGVRAVYRGSISAVHHGTTSLATVNTLPMESYLRSVVPSEMPSSFHPEALKAQAVAARTYAARGSNGTAYYDACDTTSCQVYRGQGMRNADGSVTSYERTSTDTAVAATAGQVLTYVFSDGVSRLATTMYSSSNGGYEAPGSAGHGYLAPHADPYDGVSGNSRHLWSATLPVAALEARYGIARVERVQITGRDGYGLWGGRVISALVEGFAADGTYAYATASGNGLMAGHSWPSFSDGLSSNYFTIAPTVSRLAGPDRYATAAAVAGGYAAGVPVVYVASGLDFPDALAGAARAAYNGGPLLLTDPTSLPDATRAAMVSLAPGRVVVLGGEAAVSAGVAETLRQLTTSGGLQRVSGPDRYATAAALASYYPVGGVAYVASGENFPDSLAGAALAGRDRAPLLLTTATALPQSTADALARLAPSRIVVLGGTGVVSAGVAQSLGSYATTGVVQRLAGADRYATAAAVAEQFPSASTAYLASGENFPDGLAGAARAGRDGVPLLLTPPGWLADATRIELTRLHPATLWVLGGSGAVSDATVGAAQVAVG